MSRSIHAFFSAVFLLSMVLSAHAQTAGDPTGHWEGLITWEGSANTPAGEAALQVELTRDGSRHLVGEITVPTYQLLGRPLVNISSQSQSVSFQVALSVSGDNLFKGVLAPDGKSISGDFMFQGTPLPFTLKRTGEARMELPTPSTKVAKELEGTWNGAMTRGDKTLRLVLTLSNQPDGPAKGVIVTLDQGNLEIPITTISQNAANLALDLKAAGGAFSGTVNADSTQIAGSWTQGTLVIPLTFKRGPR